MNIDFCVYVCEMCVIGIVCASCITVLVFCECPFLWLIFSAALTIWSQFAKSDLDRIAL